MEPFVHGCDVTRAVHVHFQGVGTIVLSYEVLTTRRICFSKPCELVRYI